LQELYEYGDEDLFLENDESELSSPQQIIENSGDKYQRELLYNDNEIIDINEADEHFGSKHAGSSSKANSDEKVM